MKKKLSALALALVLALSLCLTGCGGSDTLTLNVYNWGEYISDGSDGSLDTIHAFEDWYGEHLRPEGQGQLLHLRQQRGPVRQAQKRRGELRCHHPLGLHDRPAQRRGDAPAPEL
ncbi:MAG: hypothetical protein ACLT9P_10590 [Evtepia gabavorous]